MSTELHAFGNVPRNVKATIQVILEEAGQETQVITMEVDTKGPHCVPFQMQQKRKIGRHDRIGNSAEMVPGRITFNISGSLKPKDEHEATEWNYADVLPSW